VDSGASEYGDSDTGVTVTTDGASDVGETNVTLNGSLTDLGGTSFVDVYFEYRHTNVTTWSATATQTASSAGGFSAAITGLGDGVAYEFRAVALTSDGNSVTGSPSNFTTTEHSVVVSTDGATAIGETTATLNGSVTDRGNANSADIYFEYREAGSSSWNATSTQTLTSAESFTQNLNNLKSGTDHEFRAVALASDGDTDTGGSVTFVTVTAESDPAVGTFSISEAGSPNPHAEINVDWAVFDVDGDLSLVTVSVADSTGATVKSSTTSVSGSSVSGSDSLKIKHGGGEVYEVTLRVEDNAGNVVTETGSVSS